MPLLVLASAKGGGGKTTLAANLAFVLEAEVVDLDTSQQSLSLWAASRPQGPRIRRTIDPSLPGWVVVDTPPRLDEAARQAVQVADLVLIPLRPSPLDFQAAVVAHELAVRAKRRVAFVIAQATRSRLLAQAIQALKPRAPVLGCIMSRIAFPVAWQRHETVCELEPRGPASMEICALAVAIIELVSGDRTGKALTKTLRTLVHSRT